MVVVTVLTGTGVKVSSAPPLCPSLVAVIVLVPTATAVMTPVALTVATVVLDDCHVTVRPCSTLPLASFSTAVAWSPVVPRVIDGVVSVTTTVLTGGAVAVTLTSRYVPVDTDPRTVCDPTVDPSIQVSDADPSAPVVRVADAAPLMVPPPA